MFKLPVVIQESMFHATSSKQNKLVVLDANFYWSEQLFSAYDEFADILLIRPVDFRAFKKRYGSYFVDTVPQQIDTHIWEQRICCPPGWLFHYWPLTQQFLKQAIHKFQGQDSLIFAFSYPYYAALAESLDSYSIYYAIDDYQDYWPRRQAQTVTQEERAIAIANLTLCTAKHRLQQFQKLHPAYIERIIHIPHGCSSRFLVDDVLKAPRKMPEVLRQTHPIKRPVAGYAGALNYRFDFGFLATVATQLPQVTFVLGGKPPIEADGSADWWKGAELCKKLSNIRFIGFVPHHQLGTYLQSFDVLLMVYSNCNFNTNACPTKLWDYMGTSLPIVANSAVPEVSLWQNVLHVAPTTQQYEGAILKALTNPSWKAAERLKIARANTWKAQARKLHSAITSFKEGSDYKIPPEMKACG